VYRTGGASVQFLQRKKKESNKDTITINQQHSFWHLLTDIIQYDGKHRFQGMQLTAVMCFFVLAAILNYSSDSRSGSGFLLFSLSKNLKKFFLTKVTVAEECKNMQFF
jgi:hypothetical protein